MGNGRSAGASVDNRWQLSGSTLDSVSSGILGQNSAERTAETIFGRDKQTGAPLGMQHEHDVPRLRQRSGREGDCAGQPYPAGESRTAESESSLMLRRGYSYSLGVTNSGQLDMGLLFVWFTTIWKKASPDCTKRLNGEALEEYVKTYRRRLFFCAAGSEGRERLSRKRVIAGLMFIDG